MTASRRRERSQCKATKRPWKTSRNRVRMCTMNGLLAAAALILGMHPVTAASDDASRLPPEYACHARYIRLDDVSQERRADIIRVLALHVNQLSQASEVVPPWIVPGTNLTLVRIHA